ncbi:endonuclease [Arthrobacter sp. AQ5-06]|nr:endonuclease [Arthrobacter sp. AQ5-06]
MESRAAWGTECRDAFEAVAASVSVLGRVGQGANSDACGPDPLRRRADACLDGLAAVARAEARMAAMKVHLAAEYADAAKDMAAPAMAPQESSAQEMGLVAEVACVLRVSERTAGALLAEAHTLTTSLPLTLSALQAGTISWQHARILVDETSNLDPDGAKALEAHFLDPDDPNPARGCPAGELVPGRLRHKARTWRERHHPISIEKRHTRCVQDRRLEYAPDRDGMAWLSAYLPADQAAGIWERTTSAARALQGPDEDRTLSQLRADTAATWLLGGTGEPADELGEGIPSPRAQVLITVPVLSLLGVTDEPATLDGYGPIPPSMARQLIANGAESFHRVLTDPRDGAPLEIGRTSYRLTKAQRQWLRLRDGKCPFPGCSNHSLDNEADHLLAWAHGGTTGISNLGQPCPKHHRLRHTTVWTPTTATKNEPPGWISPTGRHYASEQPDWEPPHWPDHLPAMAEHMAKNLAEHPEPAMPGPSPVRTP